MIRARHAEHRLTGSPFDRCASLVLAATDIQPFWIITWIDLMTSNSVRFDSHFDNVTDKNAACFHTYLALPFCWYCSTLVLILPSKNLNSFILGRDTYSWKLILWQKVYICERFIWNYISRAVRVRSLTSFTTSLRYAAMFMNPTITSFNWIHASGHGNSVSNQKKVVTNFVRLFQVNL